MSASPSRQVAAALDAQTQSMIAASLDRFIDAAYRPEARLERLNRGAVDYRAYWPQLADIGVLAIPVSEAQGGIGGNAQDMAAALRVLSRGLLLEPLVECAVIASSVLRSKHSASEDLGRLLAGEVITILLGGRRGDSLRCEVSGKAFVVSGVARAVPGAAAADQWLIAGRDAKGVARILQVNRASLNVDVKSFRLMDGRSAGDVEFKATPMPAASLWLEADAADAAVANAAAQAVSAYCADASGVMACAVKQTGDYLVDREQFGVKLSSFQALQHRYADMHMAALEASAISRELARSIDAQDAPRVTWLRYAAPTVVARAAALVGQDAIQMHGGMGASNELTISHYNARLVVLSKLLDSWSAPFDAGGDYDLR